MRGMMAMTTTASSTKEETSTAIMAEEDDDREFTPLTEGLATIYCSSSRPEEVFYNPVQEFNRDLSIVVIQQYLNARAKENPNVNSFRILEALSATGLRSIRYAKELDVSVPLRIVANDLSQRAFTSMRRNVKLNGVEDRVTPNRGDASHVMYTSRFPEKERFDVIDVDPYGSPATFLDGAVQSVAEGGLLCVTCTDMAVLAGNAAETCYTKYGAVSLKSKCSHEMALRIVLQCIEAHANRYSRYIVPMLSLSIDFYVRLFVRVFTSQKTCKKTTSKLGHVYQCTGCESINTSPLGKIVVVEHDNQTNTKYKLPTGPPVGPKCQHCSNPFQMGGPFWLAPMHDVDFVKNLLIGVSDPRERRFNTVDRITGMLSVVEEELPDVPFYYNQDRLYAMLKVGSAKSAVLRSALLNAGYRVSLSHANKLAIKTDAPNCFVWRMMRAYAKQKPSRRELLSPNSIAFKLRQGPDEEDLEDINFDLHDDAIPDSKANKLKRFQINPLPNWGPKMKAHSKPSDMDMKRKRNQGRKNNVEATSSKKIKPDVDDDDDDHQVPC